MQTNSSFTGFLFTVVPDSILIILKVTDVIVKTGVQSVSNISKQINPLEKTYGLTGIFSTNVTEGFFNGYKILLWLYILLITTYIIFI